MADNDARLCYLSLRVFVKQYGLTTSLRASLEAGQRPPRWMTMRQIDEVLDSGGEVHRVLLREVRPPEELGRGSRRVLHIDACRDGRILRCQQTFDHPGEGDTPICTLFSPRPDGMVERRIEGTNAVEILLASAEFGQPDTYWPSLHQLLPLILAGEVPEELVPVSRAMPSASSRPLSLVHTDLVSTRPAPSRAPRADRTGGAEERPVIDSIAA